MQQTKEYVQVLLIHRLNHITPIGRVNSPPEISIEIAGLLAFTEKLVEPLVCFDVGELNTKEPLEIAIVIFLALVRLILTNKPIIKLAYDESALTGRACLWFL